MNEFRIDDITIVADDRCILKDFSLTITQGEWHALLGPNGAGKSSLLKAIAGHPDYKITKGKVFFGDSDITNLPPHERAKLGIFLAFQHPISIPGVSVANFIRASLNSLGKQMDTTVFYKKLYENMERLHLDRSFSSRSINVDFSGGEKKRCETLQMLMLDPAFIMLDEIDSGLDVDALKYVTDAILSVKNQEKSGIIISHQQGLLENMHPDNVHILGSGKIIRSGDLQLLNDLSREGYSYFTKE